MEVLRDPTVLAQRIRDQTGARPSVVAVDGADGSGKSTLCRHLASKLGAVHIELDEMLDEEQSRTYAERINPSGLQHVVEDALQRGRSVVLDGILLETIMARTNLAPDIRVYVKRLRADGAWHDGGYLGGAPETPRHTLEDLRRHCGYDPSAPNAHQVLCSSMLNLQVAEYHNDVHPDRRADYVFERVDDSI